MKKVILKIGGMSCSACSSGLEKHLNKKDKIISASVNLVLGQVLILYEDDLTINEINEYIKESGFEALGEFDKVKEEKKDNKKRNLIIFLILSIIVLYISMAHMINLKEIPFLSMMDYPKNYSLVLFLLTIPYLIYGFDIFKSGYKNLIHKSPNMDTLVFVGVITSFLYSLYGTIRILNNDVMYVQKLYYESACIIIFFVKLGRFIDSKNKEKTKDAIKELVTITPTKAIKKVGNKDIEVTIDEIKVDDVLVCKPGDKVAVDGIILKGKSHFDEAFITGESMPVKKKEKDKVNAGSINIDGYILYSAKKIGKDSTISEIVRLVVEASNTKAKISKISDKVCSIFVPVIILIAALTFITYFILGSEISICLNHFVSVLLVACPCALGLATPLAIVISEGLCAKKGILVKTSETLEKAHLIDTVVFDKTGTLTYGNLKINKIYNYSSYQNKEILKIVSSVESMSSHPISMAFKGKNTYAVKNFKNIDGIGIYGEVNNKEYYIGSAKIFNLLNMKNDKTYDENKLINNGNSIVYVVENNKIISIIGIKDIIRDNAKDVINELSKYNINTIMITGDNEGSAKIVSDELKINEYYANVMPKDKKEKINDLITNGHKVMMIGDGINDAPSLAASTIGVSIKGGTDIANNSSDVILMNDNLMNIVNLILISKKTIRNIMQNLFWAFFYNSLMIPLAIGVFSKWNLNINPMFSGFAMVISSLTVTLNSLRLKNIKLRR